MKQRVNRIVSGVSRRLAALPLRFLSPDWRAQVLESLNEKMISTAPVPGGVIYFFAPSPLLRARAATLLSKEADTIRWIDSFEENSVLWDIGANVGVFSLYAAVCRKVNVLAFEPSAANFHVLARNIQLNRLSERVAAYCLAFSEFTQLGVLNLASPQMGGALSQFGHVGQMSRYAHQASGVVHGMIGLAIDEFISTFNPPFPNQIKMDVDGLELPILRGATQTLRDPRLRSLMVELSLTNKEENNSAIRLLAEAGWRLVNSGESQGSDTERAANHFFERVV